MIALTNTKVTANVRTDGALGAFRERTFDLMLDARQSQDKQHKGAIRILRQIGYETRGIKFDQPPNQ